MVDATIILIGRDHLRKVPGVSEVAGDKVSQDQVLARVLLDNLRPGLEYRVEVITESHGRQSRAVRTNIRTKPLCTRFHRTNW